MRTICAILLLGWIHPCWATEDPLTIDQHVQAVFAELRTVQPMQAGKSYAVRVAGIEESGSKEQFLRRRTAREVSDSKLSSGCGDYALLFIERIEARGFKSLLVEGVEISSASLQNHFSGHTVVALRREAETTWWLVDSTNLKVLARNWSSAETNFHAVGAIFWIGFCGSETEYSVHNAIELRKFYEKTIASIPHDFLEENLCRIEFKIDSSLVGKNGEYLNPRLADFREMQARIFSDYGIEPQQHESILLTRGDDNTESDLSYSQSDGWVGRVGLRSGCSAGLLSYFEKTIRNQQRLKSH